MTRIAVHGASGSGKTTLATALATRLGVDADRARRAVPPARLDRAARRRVPGRGAPRWSRPGWVVDGNYRPVRDLVWARAQVIVVLDLPRWRVMAQLLRRTVTRSAVRAELWNGNRESFRNLFSTDDQRNVVLWSWRTHHRYHDEVPGRGPGRGTPRPGGGAAGPAVGRRLPRPAGAGRGLRRDARAPSARIGRSGPVPSEPLGGEVDQGRLGQQAGGGVADGARPLEARGGRGRADRLEVVGVDVEVVEGDPVGGRRRPGPVPPRVVATVPLRCSARWSEVSLPCPTPSSRMSAPRS